MSGTKELVCRTHGGTFRVPIKRGRQPVRCKEDNPCTQATASPEGKPLPRGGIKMGTVAPQFSHASRVERAASTMKNAGTGPYKSVDPDAALESMSNKELQRYAFKHSISLTGITKRSEAIAHITAAIAQPLQTCNEQLSTAPNEDMHQQLADANWHATERPAWIPTAWERLATLGWQVHVKRDADTYELTAVRDTEWLIMRSALDGSDLTQTYSLWSDNPAVNNIPQHKLGFDPDEIGDGELIRRVAGCKVTWWNTLSRTTETAVLPKTGAKIEHAYDGIGDEAPTDRIIKFVDAAGSGFRAFRLGALLRIG